MGNLIPRRRNGKVDDVGGDRDKKLSEEGQEHKHKNAPHVIIGGVAVAGAGLAVAPELENMVGAEEQLTLGAALAGLACACCSAAGSNISTIGCHLSDILYM